EGGAPVAAAAAKPASEASPSPEPAPEPAPEAVPEAQGDTLDGIPVAPAVPAGPAFDESN
ncbi:MAG: hypothetical protein KGR46_11130, partial [Verrucomicrobia bacterium]|nr:hypothetical protein [Verrucomicrobiota bacterium]